MKTGLSIADDELRDNRKFAKIREGLRLEASGFCSSDIGKYLKEKYWRAPQFVYSSLKICWDYRPLANKFNCEATDNYLKYCLLFECEAKLLFWHLYDDSFCFESIFQQENFFKVKENLFLRVIGHWERGVSLTPPVLRLSRNEKLKKIDGYHRLVVALAAKAARIPFWAVPPIDLVGVQSAKPIFS